MVVCASVAGLGGMLMRSLLVVEGSSARLEQMMLASLAWR